MSFLISDAWAEAAPAAQQPGMDQGIFLFAVFVVFFFLFVWPQHKKGRDHKKMVEALSKGNEVVTNGGLLGRIVEVDDSFILLEIADGVHVHVQKHMIASMMPKGTYKASKKKSEK